MCAPRPTPSRSSTPRQAAHGHALNSTPSVPRESRPPDCGLKPCNAYSIAAATGLPRETVRRKIGRLIELGWICREDNGHLYITEVALEQFGSMLSSRART